MGVGHAGHRPPYGEKSSEGGKAGRGIGRAARTLMTWLAQREDCDVLRLSYHPDNTAARELYVSLGFRPAGSAEGDEVVAELSARAVVTTSS